MLQILTKLDKIYPANFELMLKICENVSQIFQLTCRNDGPLIRVAQNLKPVTDNLKLIIDDFWFPSNLQKHQKFLSKISPVSYLWAP